MDSHSVACGGCLSVGCGCGCGGCLSVGCVCLWGVGVWTCRHTPSTTHPLHTHLCCWVLPPVASDKSAAYDRGTARAVPSWRLRLRRHMWKHKQKDEEERQKRKNAAAPRMKAFQLAQALDHQLEAVGLGLQTFMVPPAQRSRPLRASEFRYFVRAAAPPPGVELPAGTTAMRVVVKDRVTGAKKWECPALPLPRPLHMFICILLLYIYIYIYIYTHLYVCMHACMYACMPVCVYV